MSEIAETLQEDDRLPDIADYVYAKMTQLDREDAELHERLEANREERKKLRNIAIQNKLVLPSDSGSEKSEKMGSANGAGDCDTGQVIIDGKRLTYTDAVLIILQDQEGRGLTRKQIRKEALKLWGMKIPPKMMSGPLSRFRDKGLIEFHRDSGQYSIIIKDGEDKEKAPDAVTSEA